jgi:hypothetical protein
MLLYVSPPVFALENPIMACLVCRPVALSDGLLPQIAKNLGYALESIGIRVTFVSVGPIGRFHEELPSEAW